MNQIPGLAYSCTNEDIRGVILGLDLSLEDSILAVAGSGDQAFAFLEFVRQVKSVDIVPEQIELMRQKAEALRLGKIEEFYGIEGVCGGSLRGNPEFDDFDKRRREYFTSDSHRLNKIRANLGNLVIAEPADIIEIAQRESGFSKIYLSNIFGYGNHANNLTTTQILRNIARNLPKGGLVYVANHDELTGKGTSLFDKDLENDSFLPPEFEVDKDLSMRAREHERHYIWKPAVYRKVEPKTLSTF